MLTTLLLTTLARAATPVTDTTEPSAPATPTPDATDLVVIPFSSMSASSSVVSTDPSVAEGEAQAKNEHMRRKFRTGQALGTTGALGVPVGIGTAYVALLSDDGWPLQPATEVALTGGVLTAAVSFPLVYAGTYTERSAIVGAGCTPRGQALRHAPLALLALGLGVGVGIPALGSPPENIENIGVDIAAVSWLTAAVQHVFLQADARDCGLRD